MLKNCCDITLRYSIPIKPYPTGFKKAPTFDYTLLHSKIHISCILWTVPHIIAFSGLVNPNMDLGLTRQEASLGKPIPLVFAELLLLTILLHSKPQVSSILCTAPHIIAFSGLVNPNLDLGLTRREASLDKPVPLVFAELLMMMMIMLILLHPKPQISCILWTEPHIITFSGLVNPKLDLGLTRREASHGKPVPLVFADSWWWWFCCQQNHRSLAFSVPHHTLLHFWIYS